MDRLSAMQAFVRVVEAGSFSAVARETQTTQSRVSKQVAALERELGAQLLSRTTRSLALTEAGERYFAQARRLVAEIAEAESEVFQSEQELSGWLRVAASVGYVWLKFLPLFKRFLAAHPIVKIDLRLSDGFIDLVEEGIDLVIEQGLHQSFEQGRDNQLPLPHVCPCARLHEGVGRIQAVPRTVAVGEKLGQIVAVDGGRSLGFQGA